MTATQHPEYRNRDFSILVNSSDGFDDCWAPFFTLLQRYWPQCEAPIFLNTETKVWTHPTLDICCTMVQGESARQLTWSECLIAALEKIETPLVLYFQEDYFIHQPVRADVIDASVAFMLNNPNVKHMALTRHCSLGPYEPHAEEWLQTIRQNARYRISTQAALWRVDTLKSYLRPEENGWMFEIFGTWRAQRKRDVFLSVCYDQAHGGPAIDYLHTGIIKGRWHQEIKQVFDGNGITVDYSERGFHQPEPFLFGKMAVLKRLFKRPVYFANQFFRRFG